MLRTDSLWMILALASVAVAGVLGCQGERKETPTRGSSAVLVSEGVLPAIRQEKEKFESLYTEAKVAIIPAMTRDAIVQFFNQDSAKVLVSSRPLNAEEQNAVKHYNLSFQSYKIAVDAIAVIVNNENPVEELRTTQLDSIFRGSISRWSSLGWKASTKRVGICLPDQNSGEFEIAATRILRGGKFTSVDTILHSSPEMIVYVSRHPESIGLVGSCWLKQYPEKVKALALMDPQAPDSLGIKGQYFGPHQANVYRGYYALPSEVYIYTRTDLYSVGAGFISFITSAAGQQIIVYNGLVPATMPVRLVELTNKGIQP